MARPAPRRPAAPPLALEGTLSLHQGPHRLGGADRVALLEAIDATGSMTAAAKAVGISYRTAWDRVQAIHDAAGTPLVERATGGAGGGGSRLTPHGRALVDAFRELESAQGQWLGRLGRDVALEPMAVRRSLAALGLRTSARNQLAGEVVTIERGAVNAIVGLALPGGTDRVLAGVTLASLRELGLERGTPAVALIKAPSVFVAVGAEPLGGVLSVGNALAAVVTRLVAGAVATEVQARLAGGQRMVAIASRASVERLGLARGQPVRLLFQESSVLLGVV